MANLIQSVPPVLVDLDPSSSGTCHRPLTSDTNTWLVSGAKHQPICVIWVNGKAQGHRARTWRTWAQGAKSTSTRFKAELGSVLPRVSSSPPYKIVAKTFSPTPFYNLCLSPFLSSQSWTFSFWHRLIFCSQSQCPLVFASVFYNYLVFASVSSLVLLVWSFHKVREKKITWEKPGLFLPNFTQLLGMTLNQNPHFNFLCCLFCWFSFLGLSNSPVCFQFLQACVATALPIVSN